MTNKLVEEAPYHPGYEDAGFEPKKLQDLTDEEIRHLQAQCHLKNVGYDTFIMRFARAILKKASEKSMKAQEIKPAKYSDEWWKEVAEFNKQLREQEK